MKVVDVADLAVRNLREAALRNALTIFGVAIGVASLVAMLSLGVGLQRLAMTHLNRSSLLDTIFVMPKTIFRGPGMVSMQTASDQRALDEQARTEIGHLHNVVEVNPQIRFLTEVRFEGKTFVTAATGIPESANATADFKATQGKFFSSPSARETILHEEFAKELDPQMLSLVGKDLVLRFAKREPLPMKRDNSTQASIGFSIVASEEHVRVVGIANNEPAYGFGGMNGCYLAIPLFFAEILQPAEGRDIRGALRDSPTSQPTFASLTVRVKTPSSVEPTQRAIENLGFAAFSLVDVSNSLRIFFALLDLLLGILGSVALFVSMLGVINTLVVAILERRREIGVLKALGATDGDVHRVFLMEAGLIGLSGGFFGVFLGWLIGRVLTLSTNLYMRHQALPDLDIAAFPAWLLFSAIAFAVFVSVIAALYPATRASRLKPVEALRHE